MKLGLTEKISNIILKSLKEELTDREQAIFAEWINEDPKRQIWYDGMAQNWKSDVQQLQEFDKEALWEKIESNKPNLRIGHRGNKIWLRIAATLLFLVVTSLLIYFQLRESNPSFENFGQPGYAQAYLSTSEDQEEIYITPTEKEIKKIDNTHIKNEASGTLRYDLENYAKKNTEGKHNLRIPRGGEYQLTLSDGSKVWLNAESKLEYSSHFGDSIRLVVLEGEAFFEVAKDPKRPFIVRTKQMDIEVLGTAFNVRAYENEESYATTLVEGKIKVKDKLGNIEPITPGFQFLTLPQTKGFKVEQVKTDDIVAWKDGYFIFENMELEKILEIVSKWYNIDYEFQDKQSANFKFTGTIDRKKSLAFLLNIIQKTRPVILKVENEKLLINTK